MLPQFNRHTLLFSLNSFAAAMLGLFIAFSLGLPRPFWAMTTAYIVSQPLAGAVRSKAVYRVFGTLLGAAAAVALVPYLVNAPVLLCLALALWVGGCLAISLLDRTPRSYVMMLAGYTAAIVGFPSVYQPDAIFDVAISRCEEIGLGIVCAALTHSLIFPRPVGTALKQRLTAWLGEADRWALDVLRGQDVADDRRRLAAAASEIKILSVHLPFDTSRLRETTGVVRALHERMLLLIPLLSGLADRMEALREVRDDRVRAALNAVIAWIESGSPRDEGLDLIERLETLAVRRRGSSWSSLLIESLLVRLSEAVRALAEGHALMARLDNPDAPLSPGLEASARAKGQGRLHADPSIALLSGLAAVVAILLTCATWILGGWIDGAGAAALAAVFCCFFAAMDDPVPAIKTFALFTLVSLPVSALYQLAILPAIDGFPMLALVLAPTLILAGLYMPDPRRAGAAIAVILGFSNGLSLQESFRADFASYLNANLAQFVGLGFAIIVTAGIRSMGVDVAARRLLVRTWKGLARLARVRQAPDKAAFAATLVDRLGLLTPKLATVGTRDDFVGVDALRDLRVGMNLVAVQTARPDLPPEGKGQVDAALDGVGDHFAALAAGQRDAPGEDLLTRIDAALRGLSIAPAASAVQGVSGLVGLRRNLFPKAPAFVPEIAK